MTNTAAKIAESHPEFALSQTKDAARDQASSVNL